MLIIVESPGCHQGFKLSAAVTVYVISCGGGGGGGGEIKSWEIFLVFFSLFPIKLAGSHTLSSSGKSLAPCLK